MSELSNNNVLSYPTMIRQRADKIQAKEIAYAEDVNAEFDHIVDVYNRLVSLLTGEWGDGTGRIYDLVDNAVSLANEALAKANDCVQKSGDTMTGHLNISLVPTSDYNVVNKKYVDDTIDAELADPINRIGELENFRDNLNASQVKLENANFSSTNVNDGMNELFISVSNGKKTVADAITGKGVATSGDASFKQMADNINAILTFNEGTAGGTATAQDIMYGKTAYARGSLIVGSFIPFDTMDATATAADIRAGKSAYVKGQKIYGNLIYTGEIDHEPNPDNPYPEKAEVELIYEDKDGGMKFGFIQNISSDVSAISSDRRIMVTIDNTEKKLKTYKKSVNGTYLQEINQEGILITPEYTFSELGIPENVSIDTVSIGKMNTYENESGYETRIALVSNDASHTIYIFRLSTYDGVIETENETFIAGVEGATASFVRYNKWIITPEDSGSNSEVVWSPYSYKFAYFNTIYELKDTTMGTTENYDDAYEVLDTLTGEGSSRGFKDNDIKFLNNDRVVCYKYTVNTIYYIYINVYDEYFTLLKHTQATLILSPDCLYGINGNGEMCAVTINYTNGNLSYQVIKSETGIGSGLHSIKGYITSSNNYLILFGPFSQVYIYAIDFQNSTCELSNEYDVDEIITLQKVKYLYDLNSSSLVVGSYNKLYLIEPIVNEKNLVGVRYNGETYYSNLYKTGKLTATQEDVRAGKTFIGYNGYPETGTMGGVTND